MTCKYQGCTSLNSITIPNSVEDIDRWAFSGCTNLITIIIGSGIKKIDHYAFSNCKSLNDFYCYAENVPSTDFEAFGYTNYVKATLHIPSASIAEYRIKSPWNIFKSIVALTDNDPLPNSINVVNGASYKTDVYYGLSGRKVRDPKKGIYITNGTKIIR